MFPLIQFMVLKTPPPQVLTHRIDLHSSKMYAMRLEDWAVIGATDATKIIRGYRVACGI